MPTFPIIDSHVHFMDPQRFSYDWLSKGSPLNQQWLPADFRNAVGNVDVEGVVFVEAWARAGQEIDEARFAEQLSEQEPLILGLVANAPVLNITGLHTALQSFAELERVRGVRYLIEGNVNPTFCLDDDFIAGVTQIAKAGLPFDLCVKNWGLPFASELARRIPEVLFVLDHIGKPSIKYGLQEPWWGELRKIAQLPNVTCKLSGVITEADHEKWRPDEIKPFILHAIECFGFDRVMYGSDWPVSELTHRYDVWVDILDEILSDTTTDEKRSVYRDNAIKTYRL